MLQEFSQGGGLVGRGDEKVIGISLVEELAFEAWDGLLDGIGLGVYIDGRDETPFYGTNNSGTLSVRTRIPVSLPYHQDPSVL
jgi:hypothetical protein